MLCDRTHCLNKKPSTSHEKQEQRSPQFAALKGHQYKLSWTNQNTNVPVFWHNFRYVRKALLFPVGSFSPKKGKARQWRDCLSWFYFLFENSRVRDEHVVKVWEVFTLNYLCSARICKRFPLRGSSCTDRALNNLLPNYIITKQCWRSELQRSRVN